MNIVAGYLLVLLGDLLALVAAGWWVQAHEWLDSGSPQQTFRSPQQTFRALTAAAFTLFTIGIFWQLVGYLRLEYAVGW